MIFVILRMKVPSKKRMELSQTISSLSGSIRMEKGCKFCDFCQSIEDENRLFLLEEWDTQENLMTHLESEHFKVLRGTMSLLQEPFEMMFYEKIAKNSTTLYDSEVVDTCMSLFNEKDFKMEG